MRRRPASGANGPKARRVPSRAGGATTKLPLKLSRVPRRSARDLMTDGARHAVEREVVERRPCARPRPARCAKTCRLPAGRVRDLLRRRQVAGGALVLDVSRRATRDRSSRGARWPGRTGSRAEFAIMVPRQLAPIETSSPPGVTRLLWHARQSVDGANIERVGARGPGRPPGVGRAARPRERPRTAHATAERRDATAARVARLISRTRRSRRRTSPRADRPGPAAAAPRAG